MLSLHLLSLNLLGPTLFALLVGKRRRRRGRRHVWKHFPLLNPVVEKQTVRLPMYDFSIELTSKSSEGLL